MANTNRVCYARDNDGPCERPGTVDVPHDRTFVGPNGVTPAPAPVVCARHNNRVYRNQAIGEAVRRAAREAVERRSPANAEGAAKSRSRSADTSKKSSPQP